MSPGWKPGWEPPSGQELQLLEIERAGRDRDVVRALLQLFSLREAEPGSRFRLASGGSASVYCDVKKAAQCGRATASLATLLLEEASRFGPVEAVAGVVLGGCHLSSMVATWAAAKHGLMMDVIHVRPAPKDHGTGAVVERPYMTGGRRVVLLEDVVTTGASAVRAAELIRAGGLDVVGVLAVVDRRADRGNFLAGQFPFRALFTIEELLGSGASG